MTDCGCKKFPYGTQLRRLCDGVSDIPLERTNRFRLAHGIPALEVKDISVAAPSVPSFQEKRSSIPLIGIPIDRDRLKTHILYHVLPLMGSAEPVWRRHVEWLRRVRHEFHGRLLIGVAVDDQDSERRTFPASEVRDSLRGLDAEYVEVVNDPTLGEGATFLKMLDTIQTDDPDETFFYGHTKGVTHGDTYPTSPHHLWAEAMFDLLFRNQRAVIDILDARAMAGSFLMRGGRAVGLPGVGPWWFFSGTFFAARCVDVFQRKWDRLVDYYGCVEQWPRLLFDWKTEVGCLFMDDCDNLFSADYWRMIVTPEIQRWRTR